MLFCVDIISVKLTRAVEGTYKRGSDQIVTLAVGVKEAECSGSGTLKAAELTVPDAIQFQGLRDTLIRVAQGADNNCTVIFTAKEAIVLNIAKFSVDSHSIVMTIPKEESAGFYALKGATSKSKPSLSKTRTPKDITIRNKRRAHIGNNTLKILHDHVNGFPKLTGELLTCHPCQLERERRNHSTLTSKKLLMLVHSDLAGPIDTSMDSAKYIITFSDQYSRFSHVGGLHAKGDALDAQQ